MPDSLLGNSNYMNVGCIVNDYGFIFPIAIPSYNSACSFMPVTSREPLLQGVRVLKGQISGT